MRDKEGSQADVGKSNIRRATTAKAINLSLQLVRQEYTREGYYDPQKKEEKYFASFLRSRKAKTFQYIEGGQVVGTISLIDDSSGGLPMDVLYHTELDTLRTEGKKLAEVSQFAVTRDYGMRLPPIQKGISRLQVSGALFSAIYYEALGQHIDSLVISVHPKHAAFYSQIGFTSIGDTKDYAAVRTQAVAKELNLKRLITRQGGLDKSLLWRMIGKDAEQGLDT